MYARSNKRCARNSYRDIENIALSYTLRCCYYRTTDKVKRADEYLLADSTYTLLLYPTDRQSRQKKKETNNRIHLTQAWNNYTDKDESFNLNL